MRSAVAIFLFSFAIKAQPFGLLQSELKTVDAKSSGGSYTLTGLLTPATTSSSAGAYLLQGGFKSLTFVPEAPKPATLGMEIGPNHSVILFWSQEATGYHLETSSELPSDTIRFPLWTIVTAPRGTQNVNTRVTLPIGPGPSFYRLRHAGGTP